MKKHGDDSIEGAQGRRQARRGLVIVGLRAPKSHEIPRVACLPISSSESYVISDTDTLSNQAVPTEFGKAESTTRHA